MRGRSPPPDAFQSTLTALGFAPSVDHLAPDRVELCLGNCPYRNAVRENQPVICTLHRGIALGLLDVLDPQAKLTHSCLAIQTPPAA